MLQKIKFDPSRPVIARAAGRAIVGALNFSITALLLRETRAKMYGDRGELNGVDAANDVIAEGEARTEGARVRVEQGFYGEEPLLEQAAKLRLVRDAIADDLLLNAGQKAMASDPSRSMPDVFHVGADFAESLAYQISMKPPTFSKAQLKAEAKALNSTEEQVLAAAHGRHARQLEFLAEHRADILAMYEGLVAKNLEGHPYTVDEADVVFDRLPAMARLRIAAKADSGLYKQRDRELQRCLGVGKASTGRTEAMGNIGLIDGTRREILALIAGWMTTESFKRQVDEAQSRGANMPQFAPAPHEQQPDEVEEAQKKHATA